MKGPEPRALAALAAVIRRDLQAVSSQTRLLQPLAPGASPGELAVVGYALHNLYSALENSFEQISRTFENHVVMTGQWHRELMTKMFLEIPALRPAVLPELTRPLLNELRGFRHVFRHSYDYVLDPVKLNRIVQDWQSDGAVVTDALEAFAVWCTKACEGA